MGKLTDDMTHLRGEIDTLRGARGALMKELAQGVNHLTETVSMMRSDFATDHTMRATKARAERKTFVFSLIQEVDRLLENFGKVRENWTRMGRENRGRFLLDMRKQVNDLRKDTADDLTGARLAWRGPYFKKSSETQSKKVTEGLASLPPKKIKMEIKKEGEQTEKIFQKSTLKFKGSQNLPAPKTLAGTFPDFIVKGDQKKKDQDRMQAKTKITESKIGKRKK
ncbi:MAG: hypothetical protein V2B13_19680 [Pseudomonadota bacterium]